LSVLTSEQIDKLTQKQYNDWARSSNVQPRLATAFKEGRDEVVTNQWTFKIRYDDKGRAYVGSISRSS
jgi:hypothetical protein